MSKIVPRPVVPLLLAIIVACLPAVVIGRPTLSPSERTRLEAGDVILLDVLPPGGDAGRSQGGTALAVVNAPPAAVWQVLIDWQRHSGLFPRVVGAEVLEADGPHTLVRYTVGVGPFSFGFHVDNYAYSDQRRLTWRLATDRQNALFRDSWGYWQLERAPRGTLLTYAMAARTMLPRFLTRGAERDGLVETVTAVRERAEHPS